MCLDCTRASLLRWWILSQRADHSEAIFWEMCVISLYIIITYVNATRMFDLYLRFEQWVRQALGICLEFDGSDPDYRARMEWRPNSTFQTNHFIMQSPIQLLQAIFGSTSWLVDIEKNWDSYFIQIGLKYLIILGFNY